MPKCALFGPRDFATQVRQVILQQASQQFGVPVGQVQLHALLLVSPAEKIEASNVTWL
jgi:hypothetical protein